METGLRLYTTAILAFEPGRFGPHSGTPDGMFILWFFAGPLLLFLGGGTLVLILCVPIAIFGTANFRKEMSVDRLITFGAVVAAIAAWMLLSFFCNYFDMSLLVSVFATSASLILLGIILALIISLVVTLLQSLGLMDK